MTSLRNRKGGEAEKSNEVISSSAIPEKNMNESSETDVAVVDSIVLEPTEKLALVPWVKHSIYTMVFYPVWKHLDDRGFGQAQPFICWLLIPFILSMIVWYASVVQLIEMGNWEANMEPLPVFEEDFQWGEL